MCETLRCYQFGAELNPIMRNTRQDESQAGIKTAGRNINNLSYEDDTTLMAESEEELESRDEGERREWKYWLKIQHSKNKDYGIQSYQFMGKKNGENVETVADFIFLGSKINADSDGSHRIKRLMLLGRKAMTNLDSLLKSRDNTLLTK